tara:strand:- start:454 stop:1689 length:1236 start_codon:yes stop_codon:yes gene_type:complete
MLQSKLFTKTQKDAPKDEVSKNARLLVQAGFIHKEMTGVYSYLPLGLRVLEKVKNIIRGEMDAIGGQEMFMTTLQEKENWEKTGRWDDKAVDDWFKTKLKNGTELGLAFTHEESLANILKNHVSSYKDLPIFPYQIQTKFRNELRAKSGIMRGREFPMKDMYSFTKSSKETDEFHEKVKDAYMNIFDRAGIGENTFLTVSSGGSFSKYSHEFQTLSDAGEDTIHLSREKNIAVNDDDYCDEILKDFDLEGVTFEKVKSIEVGDIYKLGTKYSEALGLTYKSDSGEDIPVDMGSYGIGVSRLMGTIVEVLSDDRGIVWPESVSPFEYHLIPAGGAEDDAEKLYKKLQDAGKEVLFDDRIGVSIGEKFADADLIGISKRLVVSKKTVSAGRVELKARNEEEPKLCDESELFTK